jgi:hypothetical protein
LAGGEEEDTKDEEAEGGEEQGNGERVSVTEMLVIARQLEKVCIGMECKSALPLAQTLRLFRAEMLLVQLKTARQTSIATFFTQA